MAPNYSRNSSTIKSKYLCKIPVGVPSINTLRHSLATPKVVKSTNILNKYVHNGSAYYQ